MLYCNGLACGWRAVCCGDWRGRLRGLLFRRCLPEGEAWRLERCGAVHTFGMRFPIDAAFCDADGTVLRLVPQLRPFRVAAARGASVTYEFPAGAVTRIGLKPGDRLQCLP